MPTAEDLNYPNSVAADSDFIYVGTKGFVVRCPIGKSMQTLDYLVPAKRQQELGK